MLSLHHKQNKQEIIELGRKFGLTTPHTSLLVLETLAQYIEHGMNAFPATDSLRNPNLSLLTFFCFPTKPNFFCN
jgi:hypothetical protein